MIEHSVGTRRGGGRGLLRALVSFPVACFTCALGTDLAYRGTMHMMWADFSAWLLAVGMLGGGLAALVAFVLLIVHRRNPALRPSLAFILGGIVVLALGLANNLVHSRDAWTSVVPEGLALSVATVVVMIVTGWLTASRGTMPSRYAGARL